MSRHPSQPRDHEPAHDVLAAEAFAVPSADPELRPGPVEFPEDPSGIAEPHDILAAEEFAMPAARASSGGASHLTPSAETGRRVAGAAAAGGLLAWLLRRRP
jgi:hypothetical protein